MAGASGSCVCGSALTSGFSHSEYRPPLKLESFFHPFHSLLSGPWGWGGWVPVSVESFVWCWRLWNTVTLCTTSLTLTLILVASTCANHPGPTIISASPVCPVGFVAPSFNAIASSGAVAGDVLHPASVPVLRPVPSLLFAQIHPPSDVSMHGSQMCLRVEQGLLC